MGVVRGVGIVFTGWSSRVGLGTHEQIFLFGTVSRRLLYRGNGRGGGGTDGGVGSDFHKKKKPINNQ